MRAVLGKGLAEGSVEGGGGGRVGYRDGLTGDDERVRRADAGAAVRIRDLDRKWETTGRARGAGGPASRRKRQAWWQRTAVEREGRRRMRTEATVGEGLAVRRVDRAGRHARGCHGDGLAGDDQRVGRAGA